MRTNCVNCGAAIDTEIDKCPFCGTSYFDLTAIDFTSSDPVALRLRLPFGKDKVNVSMLAMPEFGGINQTVDTIALYGGSTKLATMVESRNVNVDLSFHAVSKNDLLYTVKKEEVLL